ncbi:MAG: hypothetical protein ACYC4A_05870 [Desulfobulbia bacterium]
MGVTFAAQYRLLDQLDDTFLSTHSAIVKNMEDICGTLDYLIKINMMEDNIDAYKRKKLPEIAEMTEELKQSINNGRSECVRIRDIVEKAEAAAKLALNNTN